MRKLVLIAHISLDGYVAMKDGTLRRFNPSKENLDFVCGLTDEADAAMVGRVSYEMLESYWPGARDMPTASPSEIKYSNWYNEAKKIVVSQSIAATKPPKTTIVNGDISNEIAAIKKQKGKDILLFGSPSVFQQLIKAKLIDECQILVYPAIFGDGIPLFKSIEEQATLKLISTKQFTNGEIALRYTVDR